MRVNFCSPSSFFAKFENGTLKFKKSLTKNLDVDNDGIYQYVKFELEISHTLGCTKIIKSDRF
jgi:hypothetical protein